MDDIKISIPKKNVVTGLVIIIILLIIAINNSNQEKKYQNDKQANQNRAHNACFNEMYKQIENIGHATIFTNTNIGDNGDGTYFVMIPISISEVGRPNITHNKFVYCDVSNQNGTMVVTRLYVQE